jgi:hypothetical protein
VAFKELVAVQLLRAGETLRERAGYAKHCSSSDDELEGVFSSRVIGGIASEMTRCFFGFVENYFAQGSEIGRAMTTTRRSSLA